MKLDINKISARIKEAKKEGFTLVAVSKLAGVTEQYLSTISAKTYSGSSLIKIVKVLRVLDLTVDDVLIDEDN